MKKRGFLIFLLFSLVGFLILPKICLADNFEEITPEEIEKYLELPEKDVQNLLFSLKQVFTTDWIYRESSGYSTDEERLVPLVLRKAVTIQALNHLLVDAPIEVTGSIIKNAVKIAQIFLVQDLGSVFEELEKESVKRAVDYGIKALFENEIKVTPGAIEFSYISQKGEERKVIFQYVLIYQSLDSKHGKVAIRFYSPQPIEPPKSEGSIGGMKGTPHGVQGKLPPFIVEIQGRTENYQWIDHPSVKIDFPPIVADLGIKPLTVWEKYIKKPIETKIKEIEIIITKVIGKRPNIVETIFNIPQITNNIFNEIKSIFSQINPFSPAALIETQPSEVKQASVELGQGVGQEKVEPEMETESVIKPESESKPEPKLSLNEIQETLDDIAERIDVINQQVVELTEEKGVKLFKEEEKEKEEELEEEKEEEEKEEKEEKEEELQEEEIEIKKEQEIIICQKKAGDYPFRNKIIINEIAWMGTTVSSSDEWIELKNISGSIIDLIGWQLLDKDQNIKIIFNRGRVSVNMFWLLERTDDSSVFNITADLIYTGSLNNSNEALYLFDSNCQLQDEIEAFSGWPEGENSSKRTMERKDNLVWQTSSNIGGTPKNSNSNGYIIASSSGSSGGSGTQPSPLPSPPPPKILITEVQIEGAKDFIELYNPSSQSVNLNGYQLKKRNQAGSEYSIRLFPTGITIPSKNYLIWASSKNDYHQTIVADLSSSAYLSKDNSIALFDNNKNVVDTVAWGQEHTNPFVENSSFSQNPASGQTIGRKWDLENQTYQDTDNNQQDFELQFSTPKARNESFRDIVVPETSIDNNPFSLINLSGMIFTFSSSKEGSIFECQLDQTDWESCESPKIYNSLSEGEHIFQVRAEDISQNIDLTPAQHKWEIDTISPQTEILIKPSFLTNQTQANFTFSSDEENSTFECKLDEQDWEDCQSPKAYDKLPEGEHSFSARATDLAGNLEISPPQHSWTIDISIEYPSLLLTDLDSDSSLYTNEKTVKITIFNDEEATSWLLSENETEIENSELSWQDEKPLEFTLSEEGGQKTVYLWIKDEGGNVSSKISDLITLDTTSPFVQFNSLDSIQKSTDFSVSWTGEDLISGIVEYHLNFREESEIESEDWQAVAEKSYQFSGQNGNIYYFKIRAKDNAGNLSDWSIEVSTQIQRPILGILPESLEFEAIEFSQDPADKSLTIENIGFGDLNWEITMSGVDWLNIDPISGEAPFNVSVSVDISGLEAGQFQTQIEVSSNDGSKEIGVILNLLEDTSPPNPPQIISPDNNQAFNIPNITLVGQTEANALVLVSLLEVRANEEGGWELEIELEDGQNSIKVTAKDEAGNESQPTILNLILDTQPPIIVISELPEFEPSLSFFVSWSGEDIVSGIHGFQFRYSEDGINWTYWPSEDEYNSETQYNFTGEDGKTYYFQVKAKDNVGNESEWAETSTQIKLPFDEFSIVINEIAWMGTTASSYGEWIELYNNTDEEIDLADWGLFEGEDSTLIITLTKKISPKSYYLIERTTPSSPDPISDIVADDSGQFSGNGLNNDGEFLALKDVYGNVIDLIDCSEKWFAEDNDNKATMERVDSNGSGSDHANWANNNLITRNGLDVDGNKINGTPKAQNSVSKSGTIVDIQNFNALFETDQFSEIILTFLGSPYEIQSTILVPESKILVVEPGVILKFRGNNDGLDISGTLKAIGTENKKIIFASLVEGTSWKGLYFNGTSVDSELNWVQISHAIGSAWDGCPAILVEGSSINFKNSVVEEYYLKGIKLINSDSLIEKVNFLGPGLPTPGSEVIGIDIEQGSPIIRDCGLIKDHEYGIYLRFNASPTIEGNNLEGNRYPIFVSDNSDVPPRFINNQGSNNIFDAISVRATMYGNAIWEVNTLPYLIHDSLVLSESSTLEIKPGVEINFRNEAYFNIKGTLLAQGTAENRITFTAFSNQAPWKEIYFEPESQNSILENVTISYGAGYSYKGAIHVQNTSVEFNNVIFDNNGRGALFLENSDSIVQNSYFQNNEIGIRIEGTEKTPQITNYYFENNENCDIYWPSGGDGCKGFQADETINVNCTCCPY